MAMGGGLAISKPKVLVQKVDVCTAGRIWFNPSVRDSVRGKIHNNNRPISTYYRPTGLGWSQKPGWRC